MNLKHAKGRMSYTKAQSQSRYDCQGLRERIDYKTEVRKLFRVIKMFSILIVMVVIHLYRVTKFIKLYT